MKKKKHTKKRKNKKKDVSNITSKSQTWSIDVLVATGVFIVGVMIFFYIISYSGESGSVDTLTYESEIISESIIVEEESLATANSFVIGNKVDTQRLLAFSAKPYEDIKSQLGIASEFCIHFEDENGNLIDLDEDPVSTRYSIGDSKLNFTIRDKNGQEVNIPCGT